MKKVEITLVILTAGAIGMYLMSVYGGPLIMAMVLTLLSLFYFFFGFALLNNIGFKSLFKKECYKGLGGVRIVFAVLIGMALSSMVISVLFGLLGWFGAKPILRSGLVCMAFSAVLLLIEFLINRSDFFKGALLRIVIWGGLSLVLFLLA
jgi:hypothetical protein